MQVFSLHLSEDKILLLSSQLCEQPQEGAAQGLEVDSKVQRSEVDPGWLQDATRPPHLKSQSWDMLCFISLIVFSFLNFLVFLQ